MSQKNLSIYLKGAGCLLLNVFLLFNFVMSFLASIYFSLQRPSIAYLFLNVIHLPKQLL